MAEYKYTYADGTTGSSPWQRDAAGGIIYNPDGSVREGAFVGTVNKGVVTPGISAGAAMNVMGYGGAPTDGTFVDPSTVKPAAPAGAVWGGTDPNKPAGGTTTGNNKPMQIPNQPAAGGAGGGGGTNGGAVWGGTGGIVNETRSGITPWNIDGNQTVAGQLSALTNPNSPLNQQARTQALQSMNSRGIVNSSIAESAAQDAVLKNSLPIASADAATFSKAAGYNADQQNQNFALDKNLKQQWNIAELQAATQKMNNESAQLIARMNNDQQTAANRLQQDNSVLINSNNQAATAYNNTLNYITTINQNPNMDANTKTRAVAQAWYGLQTQLRTLSKVSGLDLTSSLSLRGAPGFDDKGEYVGFNDDGSTKGSKPAANAPAPGAAPASGTQPETGAGA